MSKTICKRCENEIPELDLSEEQLLEIYGLIHQDLKLFAVKKLKDEFGLDHRSSKIVVDHWNSEFGKCLWCDFSELEHELAECPKCKAFNYNIHINIPFNQEFCQHLEHQLDLINLNSDELKGFWCDGISHWPDDFKSLSKTNIMRTKSINTKAWVGKDGQTEYNMNIQLGPIAITNYELGKSLEESIPTTEHPKWISIDPDELMIQIRLN